MLWLFYHEYKKLTVRQIFWWLFGGTTRLLMTLTVSEESPADIHEIFMQTFYLSLKFPSPRKSHSERVSQGIEGSKVAMITIHTNNSYYFHKFLLILVKDVGKLKALDTYNKRLMKLLFPKTAILINFDPLSLFMLACPKFMIFYWLMLIPFDYQRNILTEINYLSHFTFSLKSHYPLPLIRDD